MDLDTNSDTNRDAGRFERMKAATAGTDDEILEWARGSDGGIEGVLDKFFGGMPAVFLPDRAKGQRCEFQYEVTTPERVHEYVVRVWDGVCESRRGRSESPKLTTRASLPTFLRLATGRMTGMQAFLRGKVKLSGNTLYAGKFERWFDRP